MQKVLLVMAVILLSGSHAIASNLKPDDASESDLAGCHLIRGETSSVNIILSQEDLANSDLSQNCKKTVVADAAPPDRGSPDTRGGDSSDKK